MEDGAVGVDGVRVQNHVMVEPKSEIGVATILFPVTQVATATVLQRTVYSATPTTVQVCIHKHISVDKYGL